jgi:hypothetical protein
VTSELHNHGRSRITVHAVAILGSCLIFAALVWVMWRYSRPAPLGEDRAAVRRKALTELRAAEAETLNTYAWQDQVKGIVRLPIAQAMRLAEREWQNPPAARSNLIARVVKATALPPKPPEKPNPYD